MTQSTAATPTTVLAVHRFGDGRELDSPSLHAARARMLRALARHSTCGGFELVTRFDAARRCVGLHVRSEWEAHLDELFDVLHAERSGWTLRRREALPLPDSLRVWRLERSARVRSLTGELELAPLGSGRARFANLTHALGRADAPIVLRVRARPHAPSPDELEQWRLILQATTSTAHRAVFGGLISSADCLFHADVELLAHHLPPLVLDAWIEDASGVGPSEEDARPLTPRAVESGAPEAGALASLFTASELAQILPIPSVPDGAPGFPPRGARVFPANVGIRDDGAGVRLGDAPTASASTQVVLPHALRDRHLYTLGQTGTGKSTFLHQLIMQDIEAGRGVCLIDPHGDLVDRVLESMPPARMRDVCLVDPTDDEYPVGLNLLAADDRAEQDRVVEEFFALFERIWPPEFLGPVFQHNVRHMMLLIMHLSEIGVLEHPGSVLMLPAFFREDKILKAVRAKVQDPGLRDFVDEWLGTSEFHRSELRGYLVGKFNVLLGSRIVRRMVGQRSSRLDIEGVLDDEKILLVKLPTGLLGEISAHFLGFLVLMKVQNALMARVRQPRTERRPFHLYVDEFQNFLTETFPVLLAEGRKFGLRMVLANQYLAQLRQAKVGERLIQGLFGNVGTLVAFRVGYEDAKTLCAELGPPILPPDLSTLPNYRALLRMMGPAGPQVLTLDPEPWATPRMGDVARQVREHARSTLAANAQEVDQQIAEDLAALGRLGK